MRNILLLLIFILLFTRLISAQTQIIYKATDAFTLDGIASEEFWKNAYVFENFIQNFPTDSLPAQNKTTVKMAFNEKNILVYARCFHQPNEKAFSQSLRRDFEFYSQDCFGFYFDPFFDGLNGFFFLISERGAQAEALIGNGTDVNQV